MAKKSIQFTAKCVECSEAGDWELVRVTFDFEAPGFEEVDRTTPYLSVSACFEFDEIVQVEFFDDEDYHGGYLQEVDLWRDRVRVVSKEGYEFLICLDVTDTAFDELREYLKVLMRADCFRS